MMENRKVINSLTEDEKTDLSRRATEVFARHGFSNHECTVWVDTEQQWLYIRVCVDTTVAEPLYCLGRDEADLAMERLDLFFEREGRYARMGIYRAEDEDAPVFRHDHNVTRHVFNLDP